jgi:hypothetical protein
LPSAKTTEEFPDIIDMADEEKKSVDGRIQLSERGNDGEKA